MTYLIVYLLLSSFRRHNWTFGAPASLQVIKVCNVPKMVADCNICSLFALKECKMAKNSDCTEELSHHIS